jgi:hypothetical protein
MLLARKPDYKIFSVTMADINKALATKTYTNLKTKVPVEYYDLLHVFSWAEANKLPTWRLYNY